MTPTKNVEKTTFDNKVKKKRIDELNEDEEKNHATKVEREKRKIEAKEAFMCCEST